MLRKIEAGNYEYTDANGLVWRVLNHGYTRGYACVMWVAIVKESSLDFTTIWGYSRKDVIERIQGRVLNGSE